jgi:hypothetical protein
MVGDVPRCFALAAQQHPYAFVIFFKLSKRAEQALRRVHSRAEQVKMGAAPVHDVAKEGFSLQVVSM